MPHRRLMYRALFRSIYAWFLIIKRLTPHQFVLYLASDVVYPDSEYDQGGQWP